MFGNYWFHAREKAMVEALEKGRAEGPAEGVFAALSVKYVVLSFCFTIFCGVTPQFREGRRKSFFS